MTGRRLGAGATAMAVLALTIGVLSTRAGAAADAKALLRNGLGEPVGLVKIRAQDNGTFEVYATVHDVAPGFHGFHIHAVGTCTAPAFTSAGGHLNPAGETHASHAGDMPVLLVNGDGTGRARFITDRIRLADLFDPDGSAVVVHAGADNYANIPVRYAPGGPDAATFATGDAGARFACGEVRS